MAGLKSYSSWAFCCSTSHKLPPTNSSLLNPRLRCAFFSCCRALRVTALRRARAYERFPELLLEHPSRAESPFRGLLLRGIAVRDVDEWQEHHMASVASIESKGGGGGAGGDGGGFVGGTCGGGERVFQGLGGQRCWLAEIDGSAVAIVEVTHTVGPLALWDLLRVDARCSFSRKAYRCGVRERGYVP